VRIFLTRLSLGCLIVSSCLSFAGDPQWVEVRSPNFSVITDAGEKRGRDVALHFEQMRSVFGALMTKANVNLSVPLQIVAFRNTKEIRQVAPIFNGKPTEMAGLFQGGQDRSFIMLDMSVENPWTVVFHEYAHQLMNGNLSFRIDPWFAEGFAEYFSSIEVDDKGARVGSFPEQTYDILQKLGMMKVADLLRVQQNTKTYNESGDHRTTFYAESSLVVHYLYDNLLIPKLSVYFDTLQVQNKPVEDAWQAAFGMSTKQFDKILLDYYHSDHFRYYTSATPPGIVATQFTVTPVALADARAVLADIHAHSPDYKAHALEEFQDVLKMDPNNASALRGVGYEYLQQHDFEHAEEYFRRAADQNSKDPRLHYYYAMLLNQRGIANEERSTQVKRELLAAIALDPSLADAYSLLGFTQAASGEPEKGMETMKKAIELSPRDEHYQFNLANIYMMNHKMDEAIAILRNLVGSGDREVAVRASQTLAQAENFKTQSQTFALRLEERNSERRPEDTTENNPTLRAAANAATTSNGRVEAPIPVPVHFVKGKLVSVDCSTSPQAVLTVSAGAKSLRLHARDIGHVIVIGADGLSCDWKNKSLAVNYRERPDGDGDVVSLEVQ
jgi:tetratricopeptide (TPR) repeat protein